MWLLVSLTEDKFDIVLVTSVWLRFIPTQIKFLATPLQPVCSVDLGYYGQQRMSWVKNLGGGARRCNFPTNSCEFPTEEIMGAQHFNVVPRFPRMGENSQPQIFWWQENFLSKTRGSGRCPTASRATTELILDEAKRRIAYRPTKQRAVVGWVIIPDL